MDILKAPTQKAVVKDSMSYHMQVLENAPYFFFQNIPAHEASSQGRNAY